MTSCCPTAARRRRHRQCSRHRQRRGMGPQLQQRRTGDAGGTRGLPLGCRLQAPHRWGVSCGARGLLRRGRWNRLQNAGTRPQVGCIPSKNARCRGVGRPGAATHHCADWGLIKRSHLAEEVEVIQPLAGAALCARRQGGGGVPCGWVEVGCESSDPRFGSSGTQAAGISRMPWYDAGLLGAGP